MPLMVPSARGQAGGGTSRGPRQLVTAQRPHEKWVQPGGLASPRARPPGLPEPGPDRAGGRGRRLEQRSGVAQPPSRQETSPVAAKVLALFSGLKPKLAWSQVQRLQRAAVHLRRLPSKARCTVTPNDGKDDVPRQPRPRGRARSLQPARGSGRRERPASSGKGDHGRDG